MTDLSISSKIDWLEYTSHDTYHASINMLPKEFELIDRIKPIPRYTEAWSLSPAGRLDIADNDRQGAHVTLLGSDLRRCREVMDESVLIHNIAARRLLVSRMDFATDVMLDAKEEPKPSVRDVWQAVVAGQAKGRLKHDAGYHKADQSRGETEYFGVKGAETRVRIYDKAAEQQTLWLAWVRIELQCRNKSATTLVTNMDRSGLVTTGKQRVRNAVQLPIWWYEQAMSGADVPLIAEPKGVSNWQRWMATTITSSVTNHLYDLQDRQFFQAWASDLLNKAYELDHKPLGKKGRSEAKR